MRLSLDPNHELKCELRSLRCCLRPRRLFRRPILGQQPGARHPFQIVLRHQPEDDEEFALTEVPTEVVSQGETSSEDEACQTQTSHDFARPSACSGASCPSSACCWSGFSDSIHSSGLMLPFHDIRARTGKALAPHLARPSPRPRPILWQHHNLSLVSFHAQSKTLQRKSNSQGRRGEDHEEARGRARNFGSIIGLGSHAQIKVLQQQPRKEKKMEQEEASGREEQTRGAASSPPFRCRARGRSKGGAGEGRAARTGKG